MSNFLARSKGQGASRSTAEIPLAAKPKSGRARSILKALALSTQVSRLTSHVSQLYILYNLKAKANQAHTGYGIIRHEFHFGDTELSEYLSTDTDVSLL